MVVMCKVLGCDRPAVYKKKGLCQKHYFRMWRNGTTDLSRKKRKTFICNPAGYIRRHVPGHPLVNSDQYVYEHRRVVYERYGDDLPNCQLCGKEISWKTCHIDHIDRNVKNNSVDNLRPLCRNCNTFRDLKPAYTKKNSTAVEAFGKIDTPSGWGKSPIAAVCGPTIRKRIKSGWDPEKAITTPSKTYKGKKELRDGRD